MDAGVVSGTLQSAPDQALDVEPVVFLLAAAGKVPATLRVTAAWAICGVIAPRRCSCIAVVALPCI